jgi:hypothetical protein
MHVSMTIEEIATAFSGHEFAAAYPYLLDNIQWTVVGGKPLNGKGKVIATCAGMAKELSQVTTAFIKWKVVVANSCVVIDSKAEYTDQANGKSIVASCDIYDFVDGMVSEITSYNVEVTP